MCIDFAVYIVNGILFLKVFIFINNRARSDKGR